MKVFTGVEIVSVKNMVGSSDKDKPTCCDSWIDHWSSQTGKEVGTCALIGCKRNAKDGGHVIDCSENPESVSEDQIFIIPLCDKHNNANFTQCFKTLKSNLVKELIKCI